MTERYCEGERFADLSFTEETFEDCDFTDCVFVDCSFTKCELDHTTLNECKFVRCEITGLRRPEGCEIFPAGSGESVGRFEDQAVVRRRKNASTHHCPKRSADVSR